MRFYKLDIVNKTTGKPMLPKSLGGMPITSLLSDGVTVNPAALNIEFDIPVSPYAVAPFGSMVRIWGLSLQELGNAFNLNDALISVYGGMSKGLPLANPKQAGLLVKGQIFQAFGNWVGLDQTVDLIMAPSTGSFETPMNFVLDWRAGTTLASALKTTLTAGLPGVPQTISISPNLVLNHDEPGYHYDLNTLSDTVKRLSQSAINDPNYAGVDIAYNGSSVVVTDGTISPQPKMIDFQDLIGQPTWIGPQKVQAKVVMRADIGLLDLIKLPPGLTTNTQAALSRFQDKVDFTGNYRVIAIHHYGNFRQPDAASWNTTLDMTPEVKPRG